MEPPVRLAETDPVDSSRGGRPHDDARHKTPLFDPRKRVLPNDKEIGANHDGRNFLIRFESRQVKHKVLEPVLEQIERVLAAR